MCCVELCFFAWPQFGSVAIWFCGFWHKALVTLLWQRDAKIPPGPAGGVSRPRPRQHSQSVGCGGVCMVPRKLHKVPAEISSSPRTSSIRWPVPEFCGTLRYQVDRGLAGTGAGSVTATSERHCSHRSHLSRKLLSGACGSCRLPFT